MIVVLPAEEAVGKKERLDGRRLAGFLDSVVVLTTWTPFKEWTTTVDYLGSKIAVGKLGMAVTNEWAIIRRSRDSRE
jgi:hypothetical protein